MAARKSCTKMTWAEAKNKSGVGGGSKNPNKAGLKMSQQPNHGKLLAAKIIAKKGPGEDERIKNRQAAKTARKDQLRQDQLNKQREFEKEQRKLDELVRPHETAWIKLKELEAKFHQHETNSSSTTTTTNDGGKCKNHSNLDLDDPDQRNLVCESRQLQLDEVLALEAIYADTDVVRVSAASELEGLQEKLEEWQEDPDRIDGQTAIVQHPALRYTFARSIDDPDDDENVWVAQLLLRLVYPLDYPLETTPPQMSVLWCMVTKKSLVVSSNKPLESMGVLDEEGLFEAMSSEAQESLLGMPSVYELLDSWLTEHLFEFIQKYPSRENK